MTDFVGWLPMLDGGEREATLTADWNAEMIEHVSRYPTLRDRSVFIGDPDDIVDVPLGPGLPSARTWTEQHFDFPGYVMADRAGATDRQALRSRLGYAGGRGRVRRQRRRFRGRRTPAPTSGRRIPGGSGADFRSADGGRGTGPRIDPASLEAPPGVEVRGFLPDLDLHHAACDVAVVQGGLSTTMEADGDGPPVSYFPLGHHFEQQVHVRHRLERHRAGRAMDYRDADPDRIADELVAALAAPTEYLAVPSDGAGRAAKLITELL